MAASEFFIPRGTSRLVVDPRERFRGSLPPGYVSFLMMLNLNANLVDLPAGAKAVSFWTGFGFRCVVVDRHGKSLYKHFALWSQPCLALVTRVNEKGQIGKDHWYDSEALPMSKKTRAWEFTPRGMMKEKVEAA